MSLRGIAAQRRTGANGLPWGTSDMGPGSVLSMVSRRVWSNTSIGLAFG
jgi:hypothetical protein